MTRSTVITQLLAGGTLLLMEACATVTQGTKETIAVTTPGVKNASCRLTDGHALDQTVTTPATVTIAKRHAPITVACSADGGQTASRTFNPHYANAAKVQMPGGYALDALSGAMWTYPATFVVPFGAAASAGEAPVR